MPGTYEVTYLSRGSILARGPLIIRATSAKLTVPVSPAAGSDLIVSWTGPNKAGDAVSIVGRDGQIEDTAPFALVSNSINGSARLTLPNEVDQFDTIYISDGKIIGRRPFRSVGRQTTIAIRTAVMSNQPFPVSWSGTANYGDKIFIVRPSSEQLLSQAYVDPLSPVINLVAPNEPGEYEILFTTRESIIVARTSVDVVPVTLDMGHLKVIRRNERLAAPNSAIELVLDATGSKRLRGLIEKLDPTDLKRILTRVGSSHELIGVRVFGGQKEIVCDTQLVRPPTRWDSAQAMSAERNEWQGQGSSTSAIAKSLALVATDLENVKGARAALLITSSTDNCDGDTALAVSLLRSQDIKTSIIGFSVEDENERQEMMRLAALGGGRFIHASNDRDLGDAIRRSMATHFTIHAPDRRVVALGATDEGPIKLAPGRYELRYLEGGRKKTVNARVVANETSIVTLEP